MNRERLSTTGIDAATTTFAARCGVMASASLPCSPRWLSTMRPTRPESRRSFRLRFGRFAGQATYRLARGRQPTAGRQSAQPVASYPRALALDELRGYPQGPVRYFQSRREARAWRQPHQEPT